LGLLASFVFPGRPFVRFIIFRIITNHLKVKTGITGMPVTYYLPYVSMEGCLLLVWKGVFSLSGYRYLGDSSTDRYEILHDGTYRSWRALIPFGVVPPGSQNRKVGPKF